MNARQMVCHLADSFNRFCAIEWQRWICDKTAYVI